MRHIKRKCYQAFPEHDKPCTDSAQQLSLLLLRSMVHVAGCRLRRRFSFYECFGDIYICYSTLSISIGVLALVDAFKLSLYAIKKQPNNLASPLLYKRSIARNSKAKSYDLLPFTCWLMTSSLITFGIWVMLDAIAGLSRSSCFDAIAAMRTSCYTVPINIFWQSGQSLVPV